MKIELDREEIATILRHLKFECDDYQYRIAGLRKSHFGRQPKTSDLEKAKRMELEIKDTEKIIAKLEARITNDKNNIGA